nr:MAG TPA: hypothetical protein [Caudoviricetes sp.]
MLNTLSSSWVLMLIRVLNRLLNNGYRILCSL